MLALVDQAEDYLGDDPPRAPESVISEASPALGRATTITADAVRYIRRSTLSDIALGKRFAVSRSFIGAIRRRERWGDII